MLSTLGDLMAEALEALFPGVKFGIGPAIENGFYYDVDMNGRTLTTDGQHMISFDRVVKVMMATGHDLPSLYKETSEGGLAL